MHGGLRSATVAGMSSRILPAAVSAALMTLAVATTASAAPKSEFRDFVVEKATATHVVEWHWLDSETRDDCTGYAESSGVQTTKVRLGSPSPHSLLISGPSVALLPKAYVKYPGTISRTFDEKIEPPCGDCGGELGECTGRPARPEKPTYDCRTQKLIAAQIPIVLHQKGMKLEGQGDDPDELLGPPSADFVDVDLTANADPFENCPPTHELGPGLPDFNGIGVRFKGAKLREILKAKPGQTVRLQGKRANGQTGALGTTVDAFTWQDDCPPLTGPGLQVCDTLSVEVELKRLG